MVNSLYHMGTGNYHLLLPANQIWRADILVLWRPHLEEMFVISIHILLVRACLPTYNKQWVKPSGKNWNCYWQHFFIMWVFVSASWLTNVPSNQQPNLMSPHLDFFCVWIYACMCGKWMYVFVCEWPWVYVDKEARDQYQLSSSIALLLIFWGGLSHWT